MCKTCSYFPVAHSIIRKTPGSSPEPYEIRKEVTFPLFKQNVCPKSAFIDKHFRRDSMGKRFLQFCLPAYLIIAQPCRLNALFPVDKSEGWRPITHHVVWGNYTWRRSHESKAHSQVSRGACSYPVIFNLYNWILKEKKLVVPSTWMFRETPWLLITW